MSRASVFAAWKPYTLRLRTGAAMSDEMSSEIPLVTESNKDRIRAGVTGHNVRYVLIVSCALVIVAFTVIAFVVRP
jgi:hypothetical protein